MKLESLRKKPRKEVMRMGPYEFQRRLRDIKRKNFEMKKWIRAYYDRMEVENK
jgi:hypothetical protein